MNYYRNLASKQSSNIQRSASAATRTRGGVLLRLIESFGSCLLVVVLFTNGCSHSISWTPSSNPAYQSAFVGQRLAQASGIYFSYEKRWPASLSELQSFPSDHQMTLDQQKFYAEAANTIPWDSLKEKVLFKKMPNGDLSISVPPLDMSQPSEPVITIVKVPE